MKTFDELFILSTSDFLSEVADASFTDRFLVWKELQKRILADPNDPCLTYYLIPMLSPAIDHYKYKLPAYGTYREDFEQEAVLDIYLNIENYQPCYNGCPILGSVYFGNRIKGIYTKFCRVIKKESLLEGLTIQFEDGGEAERLFSDTQNQDMLEVVIKKQVLDEYTVFCKQYDQYYAQKKTAKWAKKQGLA